MHIAGINWVAVLAAAAAFVAIGYVIHMRLVDLEAWDAAKHTDKAQLSMSRMAFGMILPLATAIGLAVLFSWAMSQALPTASNGRSSLPWRRGFRCFGTTGSMALRRSGSSRSTVPIS